MLVANHKRKHAVSPVFLVYSTLATDTKNHSAHSPKKKKESAENAEIIKGKSSTLFHKT